MTPAQVHALEVERDALRTACRSYQEQLESVTKERDDAIANLEQERVYFRIAELRVIYWRAVNNIDPHGAIEAAVAMGNAKKELAEMGEEP